MSSRNKENSIKLRRQGYSLREIADKLFVSKGSISSWVKDVILSSQQKLRLKKKIHSPVVVERRRQSRLRNEFSKRLKCINESAREIGKISKDVLKTIGIALYWGEGAKTMKGMARISNSDSAIIRTVMRFFREVCEVKENRFFAHIHIHSIEVVKKAEKYWSNVTGIPLSQFYKTYSIKSISSRNIRKTLPYGTIDVGVCDTKLLLRILGWIEGLKRQM
ncbi:MAG: hypothetical protein AAB629_02890 [Patescibacteria group bacterium]